MQKSKVNITQWDLTLFNPSIIKNKSRQQTQGVNEECNLILILESKSVQSLQEAWPYGEMKQIFSIRCYSYSKKKDLIFSSLTSEL